jgi:hypothetical protein
MQVWRNVRLAVLVSARAADRIVTLEPMQPNRLQTVANWANILGFVFVVGWSVLTYVYPPGQPTVPTQTAGEPRTSGSSEIDIAPATTRFWLGTAAIASLMFAGGLQLSAALVRRHAARSWNVMLFGHDKAMADPTVYERAKNVFRDAGWRLVSIGRTNLPRHAEGVWLHGGTDVERRVATWGLNTVGITPKVDYADDKPPMLQVIVGAYTLPKTTETAESSEASELRQRLEQANRALEETQREREAIRQNLSTEIIAAKNERDGMQQAWQTCKRAYALSRIEWFAERVRTRGASVSVTVRFADYSDYDLVHEIERILQAHTKWPITIDGSNKPTLRPDLQQFKVIFESGIAASFDDVGAAFRDGALIDAKVGWRHEDRAEEAHLVIEVLPSRRQ